MMFHYTTVWPILNFLFFAPIAFTIYGFGHFGLSRLACALFLTKDQPYDQDHYLSMSLRGFWVGLVCQIVVSFLIDIAFQNFYFADNLCGEFPPMPDASVQASYIALVIILIVYTLTTFASLYTLALPQFIPNQKKRLYYTLFVTIPLGSSFYLFTFLPYAITLML